MPRYTFLRVFLFAESKGVRLERHGNVYQYWKRGADHTVGEASTLKEAYDDIFENFC